MVTLSALAERRGVGEAAVEGRRSPTTSASGGPWCGRRCSTTSASESKRTWTRRPTHWSPGGHRRQRGPRSVTASSGLGGGTVREREE
ncbi:hypothetical protein BRD03_00540 [Halobacteriales archaeon QS_9_68_17]|nr:MAG: hypothetical protein BRD03_00540 [Halobacteriales archaeon QS_9_68_17]